MPTLTTTGFRPEIQGLRALAVLSVIAFHVAPESLPGGFVGVDVFFVISGFLITGMLLRDVQSTGSISIAAFYSRRIRRLLPAATFVLVAVSLAASLLPTSTWRDLAEQVVASSLYYQNWWLAARAVDYLGADQAPGPLQHFWSLSVEEQYYIAWPALFVLAKTIASRVQHEPIRTLKLLIWAVFLASLAHSVHFTYEDPSIAYFATSTRAWELALGGLLAAYPLTLSKRTSIRHWLGPIGLLMVTMSFWLINSNSYFPGWIALLPTVGTAMVILAGHTTGPMSSYSLLRPAPLQFMGGISYSLYLWHWPVIILYGHAVSREPGIIDGVVIVVVSVILAHQTKIWVEDAFRDSSFWTRKKARPYALGFYCVASSLLAGLAVTYAFDLRVKESAPTMASTVGTKAPYHPPALTARDDRPDITHLGCVTNQADEEPRVCHFGNPEAEVRLVLIGDSHAVQWAPALREVADLRGWRLSVLTKSACAFGPVSVLIRKQPYLACSEWSRKVMDYLDTADATHLVFAQSIAHRVVGASDPSHTAELLAEGYAHIWQRYIRRGLRVLAIKDTPRMGMDVPACLSSPNKSIDDCSAPRHLVLDRIGHPDPIVLAARAVPESTLLDFSDAICDVRTCPAVVSNILAWRDSHHLTASFVRALAPQMDNMLAEALEIDSTAESARQPRRNQRPYTIVESAERAVVDRPTAYSDGCMNRGNGAPVEICEYGDEAGFHVALVGDTRAVQWLPALQVISRSRRMRISTVVRYSCALGRTVHQQYDCAAWTDEVVRTLQELEPDLVLISQSRGYRAPGASRGMENARILADEFQRFIDRLSLAETRIAVIADTPRMRENVLECVKRSPQSDGVACSTLRERALPSSESPDPLALASAGYQHVSLIDMSDYICPPTGYVCPVTVAGNVIWRTKHLLTAGFAASLAPALESSLFPDDDGSGRLHGKAASSLAGSSP